MRYWDSSALLALEIDEPGTQLARNWLREDPTVVTWALTRLELVAAVERRACQGRITVTQRRVALARIHELCDMSHEVVDLLSVRSRAIALLARHPLRAADASQLGAALSVAEDEPSSLTMVCLDRRLAHAAEREGLNVLTWTEPSSA